MKHLPKLFIETTVFNFYFEGKQGQKQKAAIRLFDKIAKGRYEAYTSEAVINELKKAPEEKREQMMALSVKYIKDVIGTSAEAENLAKTYIEKSVIPKKYLTDALHIAIATVNNFDFVISCNQGHIVKTKTMIGTGFVNLRQGFRQIGLGTPTTGCLMAGQCPEIQILLFGIIKEQRVGAALFHFPGNFHHYRNVPQCPENT